MGADQPASAMQLNQLINKLHYPPTQSIPALSALQIYLVFLNNVEPTLTSSRAWLSQTSLGPSWLSSIERCPIPNIGLYSSVWLGLQAESSIERYPLFRVTPIENFHRSHTHLNSRTGFTQSTDVPHTDCLSTWDVQRCGAPVISHPCML